MPTRAQRKAWALIAQRIRSGAIPPPTALPCEVCKVQAKEYHHPSGYDGPNALVVAALCKPCHEGAHHGQTYGEVKAKLKAKNRDWLFEIRPS